MTEINATEYVQRYRLAFRDIWNSCFAIDPELRRSLDAVSAFKRLEVPLFNAIVGYAMGVEMDAAFGKSFRLRFAADSSQSTIEVNRTMIPGVRGGVWQPVHGPFDNTNIELTPIDFFDWDIFTYRDFSYWIAAIASCSSRPDLVNCHAMLPILGFEVTYLDPSGDSASG